MVGAAQAQWEIRVRSAGWMKLFVATSAKEMKLHQNATMQLRLFVAF
jgi:hypothetical protein